MSPASVASGLTNLVFDYFRDELKSRVGIAIADNKVEMITGRLRKRLVELKIQDFNGYADLLRSLPEQHPEWEAFVNCLTTNKTDFFREPDHFKMLTSEILAEWRDSQQASFDVWCAASSTGEEPFTLAMVLKRAQKEQAMRFSILATDIDSEVLERARRGVYPLSKLDEIPLEYRRDSIAIGTGAIDKWMKIKNALRTDLSFQSCNLVKTPYNLPKKYDVIFCRNVLIYFTAETISLVVAGIYESAKPGAYLIIGHSESLHNISSKWQYVRPSVYQKKG